MPTISIFIVNYIIENHPSIRREIGLLVEFLGLYFEFIDICGILFSDGTTCLDRGWLTAQSEIQLLIHGRPLTLQGNSTNGIAPFGFKVTARHEKPVATENGESSTSSKKQMKNYDVLPVFMSVSVIFLSEHEVCYSGGVDILLFEGTKPMIYLYLFISPEGETDCCA